jgi:mono/diheme cytochrome c family protein
MRSATILIGLPLLLILFATVASAVPEAGDPEPIDFTRDIWPVFQQRCIACHGAEQQEGQLRLDAEAVVREGGISGPPFHAGQSAGSLLLRRLQATDVQQRMPLDEDPLSADQIAKISRWIDAGAHWPAGIGAPVHPLAVHWAYLAPQLPELPAVQQADWPQNPLDRFVLAQLEQEGMVPAAEANPATRLRRVYLDLIGLPPSPEEVQRFLSDPSPGAYEQVVDRLLASPRFGEKWARGWLDMARYSDSNGYQADQLRDLWAYRDWVIAALNSDMPYDDFTIEQIAGDLLPERSISQKIATGFHRTPTCNIEAGVDPEENRTNQVIDRVNTTATVWLGTTLECAQCHNHKYDPFTQEDYYRLFAYFNNTPLEVENVNRDGVQFDFYGPKMELPLDRQRRMRRAEIASQLEDCRGAMRQAEAEAMADFPEWQDDLIASKDPKKIKLQKLLAKLPEARSDSEQKQIEQDFFADHETTRPLRDRLAKLTDALQQTDPDTTLVMIELAEPRATRVFKRGVFRSPGAEVEPGVPAALHPLPEGTTADRLGLAQWLVDPNNPLTARVRMNQLWAELFGRGLVTSGEDFGTQGAAPSHPELLDWLAVNFMRSGWSTKRMLKGIVISSTYQQSSRITPAARDRDPENVLLARGPRFRLPAETIRDNGLAIAGLLEEKMGGPPVYPPQPSGLWHQTGRGEPVYHVAQNSERHRRGVYVVWRRAAPYPSFVNFDAPDRTRCIISRPRTNTPMQALTLLNDEAYVEMAQGLAARILTADVTDDDERIARAFQMCVARLPEAEELSILRRLLEEERQRLKADPQDVVQLTHGVRLPEGREQPADASEWAAWFCLANALLNLDETINKE